MKRFVASAILILLVGCVVAQKKTSAPSFIQNIHIEADGQLSDWPTSALQEIDPTNPIWSYAMGYDHENLYVAVSISNPELQLEAAVHGISVMINADGKKKDGMQLLFPVPDAETIRALTEEKELSSAYVRDELLKRTRGFGVKGFPRIVNGLLSLNNNYGIRAIVKMNEQDQLIYESVIPLKHLETKDKPVAIQVGIQNRWTHMQKVMARQSSAQNPYANRRMPTSRVPKSPYSGKTEIWVIDQLPTR